MKTIDLVLPEKMKPIIKAIICTIMDEGTLDLAIEYKIEIPEERKELLHVCLSTTFAEELAKDEHRNIKDVLQDIKVHEVRS